MESVFCLTAAVFQTRDRYLQPCTASTLTCQWRATPTMMSSLRFYFSSMKIRRNYLRKCTIHLPRCSLNPIHFTHPHNLHHQPPPTSRQTNRFGPKYTPSNHPTPSWASSLTFMSTDSFFTNTWTASTPSLTPLSDINLSLKHSHHPSSGSLPFTTTTYNASRATRAWLSMPLTPWLGFPQQHISWIPT